MIRDPDLSPAQRKYLKGLAHRLKPVVMVGQGGISAPVLATFEQALLQHELIKVRFLEAKAKAAKEQAVNQLSSQAGVHLVGVIGHVGIFYRSHPDPENRRIHLPPTKSKP